MSPHRLHSLPSPAALGQYGITENGFLPASEPLRRLSDPYYGPWEELIREVPNLLDIGGQIDLRVQTLPVLSVHHLQGEAEWQRAYSVLAVLAQAYIWDGDTPNERLPPGLSIPFIAVAEHLEIPPVATYSALNLWNFRVNSAGADLTNPDNLTSLCSFTGTNDESWFFVVSNAMEARAAPLLKTMLGAMEAVSEGVTQTVVDSLAYLTRSLDDIGRLLERMDERCNPQVFYHNIRPMLAGSKNMESSGLPYGVFFDRGNGEGEWRRYRGGSNGQSSLIQFFDVVLGVDHGKSSFHKEMREYMPGQHSRFLYDLEEIANIRGFVEARQTSEPLITAYNGAVRSLSAFRNKHIQLVSRYIILPSRQPVVGKSAKRSNIASTCREASLQSKTSQGLVGTGGTQLIPFLKGSRDETTASMIK